MPSEPLGPAASTWNDYVGTAAADDADVRLGSPSLYQLAGLDRDQWRVVGVDIEVRNTRPAVTIYAVDLNRAKDGGRDIEDVVDEHERVPVTAIELVEQHVETFLNQAFRRIAVRLVTKGFRDEQLIVSRRITAVQASAVRSD